MVPGMSDRYRMPVVPVAKARDALPSYLEAARKHLPQIVTRHDRDEVALLSLDDLRELLRGHRFLTEASVHPGEATVTLPQFGIIGIGDDLDAAAAETMTKLREYAEQYLQRYEFYRHTDRRDLFPLVMRFLVTPEDEQLNLLLENEGVEAAALPA
jgi:hypothetical protein